jgi:hypothetical protein
MIGVHLLREAAQKIAATAGDRPGQLDHEISRLEMMLTNALTERDQARAAAQRLQDFPVLRDDKYVCPACWIRKGMVSLLFPEAIEFNPVPVASESRGTDRFRCSACDFVVEIPREHGEE